MRSLRLALLAVVPFVSGTAFGQGETPGQIALLVDCSESMRYFENVVAERLRGFAELEDNDTPIEIALVTYGHREGGPRTLSNFTNDLDKVVGSADGSTPGLLQEALANLEGGTEECGLALRHALDDLTWNRGRLRSRLVVIVGNESFEQGPVSANKIIKDHLYGELKFTTSKIYCGPKPEARRGKWDVPGMGTMEHIPPQ